MGSARVSLCLAIVALLAQPVCGCQCGEVPSIARGLATADAVFAGRVVEVWPVRVTAAGDDCIAQRATLRADARFKGVAPMKSAAAAEQTLFETGGNCSYRFTRGEAYLVFAKRGADGRLGASICSPTRGLAELGSEDLAALGVAGGGASALDRGPVAPESLAHLAARRGELAVLVAAGAARAVWRGWGETASGLFLRLALTVAAAGALPMLLLLLRRRRFLLCAQIFVAGPLVIGASVLGWAYWYASSHPWLAALAR